MPYLVITHQDALIDRRPLDGPVTVGRAQDCDIAVRDILLSRKHLVFAPVGDDWQISDLGSKNGTSLNGEPLKQKILQDGDSIRMGKTRIVFFAGAMSMDDDASLPQVKARPVDPVEALAGTIASYTYNAETEEFSEVVDFPSPRPMPKYPLSYERESLHSLLTTIASSSWDSIYAEARQSIAAAPHPAMLDDRPRPGLRRPRSPVDLSLQVCVAGNEPKRTKKVRQAIAKSIAAESIAASAMTARSFAARSEATTSRCKSKSRLRNASIVAAVVIWGAVLALGVSIWTVSHSNAQPAAAADMIPAHASNPLTATPDVMFPVANAAPKTALTPEARAQFHHWLANELTQCQRVASRWRRL